MAGGKTVLVSTIIRWHRIISKEQLTWMILHRNFPWKRKTVNFGESRVISYIHIDSIWTRYNAWKEFDMKEANTNLDVPLKHLIVIHNDFGIFIWSHMSIMHFNAGIHKNLLWKCSIQILYEINFHMFSYLVYCKTYLALTFFLGTSELTHWGCDKMAAISQMTLSNTFLELKSKVCF